MIDGVQPASLLRPHVHLPPPPPPHTRTHAPFFPQGKDGIIKPIEVQLRPKGQALGFGVRHRDDEWDEEKAKKGGSAGAGAAAKV